MTDLPAQRSTILLWSLGAVLFFLTVFSQSSLCSCTHKPMPTPKQTDIPSGTSPSLPSILPNETYRSIPNVPSSSKIH